MVEEEYAFWRDTYCYAKISLISLGDSAIFTVKTYANLIRVHGGKRRPVYELIIQEQIQ